MDTVPTRDIINSSLSNNRINGNLRRARHRINNRSSNSQRATNKSQPPIQPVMATKSLLFLKDGSKYLIPIPETTIITTRQMVLLHGTGHRRQKNHSKRRRKTSLRVCRHCHLQRRVILVDTAVAQTQRLRQKSRATATILRRITIHPLKLQPQKPKNQCKKNDHLGEAISNSKRAAIHDLGHRPPTPPCRKSPSKERKKSLRKNHSSTNRHLHKPVGACLPRNKSVRHNQLDGVCRDPPIHCSNKEYHSSNKERHFLNSSSRLCNDKGRQVLVHREEDGGCPPMSKNHRNSHNTKLENRPTHKASPLLLVGPWTVCDLHRNSRHSNNVLVRQGSKDLLEVWDNDRRLCSSSNHQGPTNSHPTANTIQMLRLDTGNHSMANMGSNTEHMEAHKGNHNHSKVLPVK